MKRIIALALLFTWIILLLLMMGEPRTSDHQYISEHMHDSVSSGSQWIGWSLAAFILFTPFIVIKLMDGKTK